MTDCEGVDMTKARASRPCPIPGCFNRTWAKRGLDVCGDCAQFIAHTIGADSHAKATNLTIENQRLRRIIARQTAELLILKGTSEPEPPKLERPTEGVIYFLRSGGYIKIG